MTIRSIKTILTLVTVLTTGTLLLADGLRNPPEGMTGLGKIGGKVVYNDDASTVTHNPANLVEQTNASFIISAAYSYGTRELTDGLGRTTKSKDNSSVLPNLFFAMPVNEDTVAGIALTTPFGRSTTFDKDSPIRYSSAYFTELVAVNLNPTIAYRVNDSISVAAGVDILMSELDLKQAYPWSMITGTPDGESRIDADGTGLGFNAALTWNISDSQKAAITYRSSISVDYEGDFNVSGKPPAMVLPFPLSLASDSSSFETEIEFPSVVTVGYGLQVTDRLRVEANVEWIEHSTFDTLSLDAENNNVLLPSTEIESNWDDNWTYGLGADYVLNESWIARAGIIHLESPIPTATMLPSFAEGDQTYVSAGVGYRNGDHIIDAAVSYGFIDDRTVTDNADPLFNGDYEFESYLIGVSYGRAL